MSHGKLFTGTFILVQFVWFWVKCSFISLQVEYFPPPPPPPPVHVIEKQIYRVRNKPHHHFRKTAFVGGYIGAGGDVAPPPPPPPVVVHKIVTPVIEKRIDVATASDVNAGANAYADVGGGGQYTYRKRINFQSNPNFFQDIFNVSLSSKCSNW